MKERVENDEEGIVVKGKGTMRTWRIKEASRRALSRRSFSSALALSERSKSFDIDDDIEAAVADGSSKPATGKREKSRRVSWHGNVEVKTMLATAKDLDLALEE